jgi:hypothetical protein
VNVIGHSYSGTLTFSTLWAQHNENRILLPNLIVLLLARTTHLNIVFEEYLGAVMLCAAIALFILTHRRRSPSTPWIVYCPFAILLLTLAQSGNTLWGFQMAWYLVLLLFASALFLLDRPHLDWFALASAAAVAILASFSSLQGLLIWPVGLVLLLQRKRPRSLLLPWVLTAATTAVLYSIGLNLHASAARGDLGETLRFFFVAIGDVIDGPAPGNVQMALGIATVLMAIWVLVRFGGRHDTDGPAPIAVALILYGLFFALITAYGRSGLGLSLAPRYIMYDILVLAGTYLAIINNLQPLHWDSPGQTPRLPPATSPPEAQHRPEGSSPRSSTRLHRWDPAALLACRTFLAALILLQIALGTENGLADARQLYQSRVVSANVLANIQQASPLQVFAVVNPLGSITFARRMATVAERYHLSLFATGDAARYREEGLDCLKKTLNPVRSCAN